MSAEPGSKMTFGQKLKFGGFLALVALALLEASNNWAKVPVHYFPFVQPVDVPLTLVCLVTFGFGCAATFVYVSMHTLKKNKDAAKPPSSLPPAAPPASP